MKLNPSGDDTRHVQQIINEMGQLSHLTLQHDFGFPLNWVLCVFETKDMQSVEDRGQGIAQLMGKPRQDFVLAMVKFCQRLRLLVRLSLQTTAFGNVPNVALYYLALIHLVEVADKFDLHSLSLLGLERQIFIANITYRLLLTTTVLALCLISEDSDLPGLYPDKFYLRISQQL